MNSRGCKAGLAASLVAILMAGSLSAQAAVVRLYDATVGGSALDSIADAEGIIAAAAAPDLQVASSTIDYSGDSFPGVFGAPPNDIFVMRVTGTLDTSLYSQLAIDHDDGFVIRFNGVDTVLFDSNTGPTTTLSPVFANAGTVGFEMVYWDQGGLQVARVLGVRRDTGARELAQLGDARQNVPEPASWLLASVALLALPAAGRARRRHPSA